MSIRWNDEIDDGGRCPANELISFADPKLDPFEGFDERAHSIVLVNALGKWVDVEDYGRGQLRFVGLHFHKKGTSL